MNIQPNSKALGLITLLVIFCFSNSAFAQNGSTHEEDVQRYEELIEYRTNYTIEQDEDAQNLSETFTGIDLETPETVYLGDLTLEDAISEDLPKVTLEDPTEEETLAYGSYEHVEYQDMFDFEESDGNGNAGGFGLGVTGGKGNCPHGWNW